MTRLQEAIGLGFLLGLTHGFTTAAHSVPVVPNFTQGSLTSRTETTSVVSETINSIDYNTGYQYSVTGTNVRHSGGSLAPQMKNTEGNTVNGISSTWTTLNSATKPSWAIVNPGQAFQFTETFQGPGLANQTVITRKTEIQSVTESTSIFSQ
jgi:hypothetical protein